MKPRIYVNQHECGRLSPVGDRASPRFSEIGRCEADIQPLEGRRLPGIALATTGLWRPLPGLVSETGRLTDGKTGSRNSQVACLPDFPIPIGIPPEANSR